MQPFERSFCAVLAILGLGACASNADVNTVAQAQTIGAGGVAGSRAYGSLSLGSYHRCVVGHHGQIYCAGHNALGQLGDGTTTDRDYSQRVSSLTSQVLVAAGTNTTCSVGADACVRARRPRLVVVVGTRFVRPTRQRHVRDVVRAVCAVGNGARRLRRCVSFVRAFAQPHGELLGTEHVRPARQRHDDEQHDARRGQRLD